ncbi:MAG: methyltransferase domain-containing protein [Actinomycetota bacterium]
MSVTNLGDSMEEERSFDTLGLKPGDRVLDVGCGDGSDALELARRVGWDGTVVGIDTNEAVIEAARDGAAGEALPVQFQVGDAYALAFDDQDFNAVRADRVFLEIERPDEALAELARVLKHGGTLYLRDPDIQTLLIDAPDAPVEVTRTIAEAWSDGFANGWIGRQLPRRLRDEGMESIVYAPRTLVLRTLDEAEAMFGIGPALRAATVSGALSDADGDAWLAALRYADEQNRFTFSLTFFECFGSKS